jgi:hypothetical protein
VGQGIGRLTKQKWNNAVIFAVSRVACKVEYEREKPEKTGKGWCGSPYILS